MLVEQRTKVFITERRFERSVLAHHSAQLVCRCRTSRRLLSFEKEQQPTDVQYRCQMTENRAFVCEVMQRIVTDDGVKFFRQWFDLNVMRKETTAQRSFVIQVVRDIFHSLAGHANQVVADVDPADVVAEPREIFAKPTGTTTHVENFRARG